MAAGPSLSSASPVLGLWVTPRPHSHTPAALFLLKGQGLGPPDSWGRTKDLQSHPGPDTPRTTLGPERPGRLHLPLRKQELGPVLLLLVPP